MLENIVSHLEGQENMSNVLLDMDGVIVDWTSGVLNHLRGLVDHKILVAYKEEYAKALNHQECKLDYAIDRNMGISRDAFWALLSNEAFWENLPKFPWSDQLISMAYDYGWYLCTSPTLAPECASGKMKWIQHEFGKSFRHFVITPKKQLVQGVLIDDRWYKDDQIIFPAPWNKYKSFVRDPINYIYSELEKKGVRP